jgi:hypothetical protein
MTFCFFIRNQSEKLAVRRDFPDPAVPTIKITYIALIALNISYDEE